MARPRFSEFLFQYRSLVLTLLLLIITVLVSIIAISLSLQIKPADQDQAYTGAGEYPGTGLSPQDFLFEDYTKTFDSPGIYYKRPVLEQWSREQVEKFWVPAEGILLEIIEKEHITEIENIFSKLD